MKFDQLFIAANLNSFLTVKYPNDIMMQNDIDTFGGGGGEQNSHLDNHTRISKKLGLPNWRTTLVYLIDGDRRF